MHRIYRIISLGHSPSKWKCPPGARASRPHALPSDASAAAFGLAPESRCCRRLRGSTLEPTLSNGLRPAYAAVPKGTLLSLPNGEASRHLQLHQRGKVLPRLRRSTRIQAASIHRIFQETAGLKSRASASPHRIIAPAGFRCHNLSSCLSCPSCASMFADATNRASGTCPYSRKLMKLGCFTHG